MKLFLKRDTSDMSSRFVVLDEYGKQKFIVTGKNSTSKQKLTVFNNESVKMADITYYDFVVKYFSVKCCKHLYALVPCLEKEFVFIIYGSTLRFIGNIPSGRFSLIDVDKSVVMMQKKCWGKYGNGFELEIFDDEQEIFSLSVAICANLYISAAEENPVPT